jgi:riboflavin-specific deaminase-like protein
MAQIGQSLDGRIATETGKSHFITGPADIIHLHRLRALVDAVVVGATTVAADNPRLTVRKVPGQSPVRVVLDPTGRLTPDKHVFSDAVAPTLHVCHQTTTTITRQQNNNISVLTLPVNGEGNFEPSTVIKALRDRGLNRVLVEGGGVTVSNFLRAQILDRLHVTIAPLIIGSGVAAFTLDPINRLGKALRPEYQFLRLGNDFLFDFDLRKARMETCT